MIRKPFELLDDLSADDVALKILCNWYEEKFMVLKTLYYLMRNGQAEIYEMNGNKKTILMQWRIETILRNIESGIFHEKEIENMFAGILQRD